MAGDNKNGKTYKQCLFRTFASPSITQYYDKWYHNKIKFVPNNLVLNGQIIAHWICDDGHIRCNKLPYRFVVEFATQSFTKDEVYFLANLLSDRYNENFFVQKKHGKTTNKDNFIIKAYDSACRIMFKDIEPYFKMDRKRIFDKSEARFWSNQPDRQKSTTNSYNLKKEQIKLIIDTKTCISYKDLAKLLSSNDKSIIKYNKIDKLLQPYFLSGKVIKNISDGEIKIKIF